MQVPQQPQQKASSTLKLATTPRTLARKPKITKPEPEPTKVVIKPDVKPASSVQKSPTLAGKSRRNRIQTQPYQSPLPELEIITKMTISSTPKGKAADDKLIIFYK